MFLASALEVDLSSVSQLVGRDLLLCLRHSVLGL